MQLIERAEDSVNVLMRAEQGLGCFRSDSWNARDIVDTVTHQRQIVSQLIRMNAELLEHIIGEGLLFFAVVPEKVLLAHEQLTQVLVTAEDGDGPLMIAEHPAESAKQIIGLVLAAGKTGNAKQLGNFPAGLE